MFNLLENKIFQSVLYNFNIFKKMMSKKKDKRCKKNKLQNRYWRVFLSTILYILIKNSPNTIKNIK